jgi:hypothetical protein
MERDEAIEILARSLRDLLERFDPTEEPEWHELSDHQREIYRATVRGLLVKKAALQVALAPEATANPPQHSG